jgi:hypothetical protein
MYLFSYSTCSNDPASEFIYKLVGVGLRWGGQKGMN